MADFSGGPGFLAFVSTFAVVVGAILLFRSLSKHLRKVRTHPPEGEKAADATVESSADATAGSGSADEPVEGDDGDDDASPEASEGDGKR